MLEFGGFGFGGGGAPVSPAGNPGEIQWNDAGAFGASSNLFWDNANGFVGIGNNSPQARLDVRAQGVLSTDIAFRVRNASDTINIAEIAGNGVVSFSINGVSSVKINSVSGNIICSRPNVGAGNHDLLILETPSSNFSTRPSLLLRGGERTGSFRISSQNNSNQHVNAVRFQTGVGNEPVQTVSLLRGSDTEFSGFWLFKTQIQLGFDEGRIVDNSYGRHSMIVQNGVAPTESYLDGSIFYSADITAGNAAPHFRTEAGQIIKLYTSPDGSSIKDIVENVGFSDSNTLLYAKEEPLPIGDVVVDFTEPKVYGKATTPNNANITDNLANAKIGVVQKIYHNAAVAPTFPAGWVLLEGAYFPSVLNIILTEFSEGTRVEYKIIQGNDSTLTINLG